MHVSTGFVVEAELEVSDDPVLFALFSEED